MKQTFFSWPIEECFNRNSLASKIGDKRLVLFSQKAAPSLFRLQYVVVLSSTKPLRA